MTKRGVRVPHGALPKPLKVTKKIPHAEAYLSGSILFFHRPFFSLFFALFFFSLILCVSTKDKTGFLSLSSGGAEGEKEEEGNCPLSPHLIHLESSRVGGQYTYTHYYTLLLKDSIITRFFGWPKVGVNF